MKISKKLNLVLTVGEGEDVTHIHSAPIGLEVFEKYHRVIAKAFAVIYADGLNVIAGVRVAAMVLKEVAEDMGRWEGADGVKNGLLGEIRRLSSVSVCEADGWVILPLDVALKRGLIDSETVAEVENQLVFFTLTSAMHVGAQKGAILEAMTGLWGGAITSLNSTEYHNSLPILTTPAIIQEQTALVPS